MSGVLLYDNKFDRKPTSSPLFLSTCKAVKYETSDHKVIPCTIGLDPYGFYFFWVASSDDKLNLVELSTIQDTRSGVGKVQLPMGENVLNRQLLWSCSQTGSISERKILLEEKCMTVVTGNSNTNLRYITFLFLKRSDARLWTAELFQLAHNHEIRNPTIYQTALKIYSRIILTAHFPIGWADIRQMLVTNRKSQTQKRTRGILHRRQFRSPGDFTFAQFLRMFLHLSFKVLPNAVGSCKNPINAVAAACRETRFGKLSPTELVEILNDTENAAYSNFRVNQDMDQPLAHYFINSSHRTYMIGAQMNGTSSVEMYRQVLLEGCRCIELDLWDGEDGTPIITHGYTLTTVSDLKETLKAIAEYAFKTTDYPLILSLENQCSKKAEKKAAKMLKEVFGGTLLEKALPTHLLETGVSLPSPEQLKNRILVKHKVTTQNLSLSADPPNFPEDSFSQPNDEVNAGVSRPKCERLMLQELVTYIRPIKFTSFDDADEKDVAHECVSLVERSAFNLIKNSVNELVTFNQRQLTRVYPSPMRISSTNFTPFFFWSGGCQMVTMNFQTPDKGMMINREVFQHNGHCGYLIKPKWMRDGRAGQLQEPSYQLMISIVSGTLLSHCKVRSSVIVELYGISDKSAEAKISYNCNSVGRGGITTKYELDKQPFIFSVNSPEMVFLRLLVKGKPRNQLLGHRVIAIDELELGYQQILLRNEMSQPLSASLLVHVEKKFDTIVLKNRHRKLQDRLRTGRNTFWHNLCCFNSVTRIRRTFIRRQSRQSSGYQ